MTVEAIFYFSFGTIAMLCWTSLWKVDNTVIYVTVLIANEFLFSNQCKLKNGSFKKNRSERGSGGKLKAVQIPAPGYIDIISNEISNMRAFIMSNNFCWLSAAGLAREQSGAKKFQMEYEWMSASKIHNYVLTL